MAHKTLINGTAYEIKGGKTLIGGTAYKIEGGKTLVGGTAYKVGFSTPISTLPVGSSVYFKVDGVSTEFIIVHHGRPSSMYDESCDGTWLLMKNCDQNIAFSSSNNNSYSSSTMHSKLKGSFFDSIDSDVSAFIKTVKIPYVSGRGDYSSSVVKSGADGLSTTCFLLSGYEVGYTQANNSALPIDGALLEYFRQTGNRFAYFNGSVVHWWLRSPAMGFKDMTFISTNAGGLDVLYCNQYGLTAGRRPAFILPYDFDISDYI